MKPKNPNKGQNLNRKNAQATRTLRACELCRKQKTRCFKVNDDSPSCLRCTFLNKPCSFGTGYSSSVTGTSLGVGDKLDLLQNSVNQVLAVLGGLGPELSLVGMAETPQMAANDKSLNPIDIENHTNFKSPSTSLAIAPFNIIRHQIPEQFIPKAVENLFAVSNTELIPSINMVTLKILTIEECINLMNDFRRNYGRWISFPSNLPTEILVDRLMRKSPLLLTTCCVISLRFLFNSLNPGDIGNITRKRSIFGLLTKQLIMELNQSLIKINCFNTMIGDIEFLQSIVIISIYSLSLTSIIYSNINELEGSNSKLKDLNIDLHQINFDPWFLLGLGLNLFVSKLSLGKLLLRNTNPSPELTTSPFTILYDEELDSNEYQTLTIMRLYNHLVLVHLMSCIFSGRMCILDEIRLNYCNITLNLPSSTNFDGRMVSEISILLIAYNYIQVNLNLGKVSLKELNSNFKTTIHEIKAWYDQWEYLFQQPALQFVELCYNYCYLIIYYSFNFQKYLIMNNQMEVKNDIFDQNNIGFILSICDDTSIKKLFEFSNTLVGFITMIHNDSYFAYLSDQLVFCFYFGGVFLINLLKWTIDNDRLAVLGLVDVNEINSLDNIALLISKFERISGDSSDDILMKYKVGLKYEMNRCFATYPSSQK